jgi:ABC-type multidrug transport system fused ATPase/permease subunit
MENYNNYYDPRFEEKKRPGFLTLLCILTFVGSGIALLYNLLLPVYAPVMIDFIATQPAYAASLELVEQVAATPIWQFYIMAFLNACSILGAVYMLKMKKIGFHIYVISQLAQMCVGQFIIGGSFKPNLFGLVLTILFIGMYAIYYKQFTNITDENNEQG